MPLNVLCFLTAKEVFSQKRRNIVNTPNLQVNEEGLEEDEDDSEEGEENLDEESESSDKDVNETEEGNDDDNEEEEIEDEETENQGETLEELAAGREEKEEDEVVTAICNAAKPQEKIKPPDLVSSSMVTDISFHPNEELVAICNIEGEIAW